MLAWECEADEAAIDAAGEPIVVSAKQRFDAAQHEAASFSGSSFATPSNRDAAAASAAAAAAAAAAATAAAATAQPPALPPPPPPLLLDEEAELIARRDAFLAGGMASRTVEWLTDNERARLAAISKQSAAGAAAAAPAAAAAAVPPPPSPDAAAEAAAAGGVESYARGGDSSPAAELQHDDLDTPTAVLADALADVIVGSRAAQLPEHVALPGEIERLISNVRFPAGWLRESRDDAGASGGDAEDGSRLLRAPTTTTPQLPPVPVPASAPLPPPAPPEPSQSSAATARLAPAPAPAAAGWLRALCCGGSGCIACCATAPTTSELQVPPPPPPPPAAMAQSSARAAHDRDLASTTSMWIAPRG